MSKSPRPSLSVLSGAGALAVVLSVATVAQQPPGPVAPIPVDPVATILDAFRTHALVMLGEPHGNEQAHRFRLSLLRDPRFAAVVNDIVVECGNALYQSTIDAFVSGENVSDAELRRVWENTTVAGTVWDSPIYEEFFRVVREVNRSLPSTRRLRVILGDPPIDWNAVHNRADLIRWLSDRERFPASVIEREVLSKGRRALIVYGDGHFFRKGQADTMSSLLAGPSRPFVISTSFIASPDALPADLATWRPPMLTLIKGTRLGAASLSSIYPLPPDDDRGRFEESFDAWLYLGPLSSMTTARLSATRCADTAYMAMRLERMALDPGPPGAPDPRERLKAFCSTQARQ